MELTNEELLIELEKNLEVIIEENRKLKAEIKAEIDRDKNHSGELERNNEKILSLEKKVLDLEKANHELVKREKEYQEKFLHLNSLTKKIVNIPISNPASHDNEPQNTEKHTNKHSEKDNEGSWSGSNLGSEIEREQEQETGLEPEPTPSGRSTERSSTKRSTTGFSENIDLSGREPINDSRDNGSGHASVNPTSDRFNSFNNSSNDQAGQFSADPTEAAEPIEPNNATGASGFNEHLAGANLSEPKSGVKPEANLEVDHGVSHEVSHKLSHEAKESKWEKDEFKSFFHNESVPDGVTKKVTKEAVNEPNNKAEQVRQVGANDQEVNTAEAQVPGISAGINANHSVPHAGMAGMPYESDDNPFNEAEANLKDDDFYKNA